MDSIRSFLEAHERLKKRIHSFRIPLSPTGQKIMGFVYFCIPIVGGYYTMKAAIAQSEVNNGKDGSKIAVVPVWRDVEPAGGRNVRGTASGSAAVVDSESGFLQKIARKS